MYYRVRVMAYHVTESVKDAQGVEFECQRPFDNIYDVRQYVVRGFLSENRFIKSLLVEQINAS